jgi:ABC-2 type transport system ATP-binding protein
METDALQRSLSDLLAWAAHDRIALEGLEARSPSLEAVFLSIADGRDPADDAHADGTERHATSEHGSPR